MTVSAALLGTAAVAAPAAQAAPTGHVSSQDHARIARWSATLRRIRTCESSGDYTINTGNGYYGAYQFAAATWHDLGYAGLPNHASPVTQDAAAAKLLSEVGTGPWRGCL